MRFRWTISAVSCGNAVALWASTALWIPSCVPSGGGQGAQAEYFHTLSDFAAFLAQKGENSASVECALTARKAGGNNPLLCAALGRLGGGW